MEYFTSIICFFLAFLPSSVYYCCFSFLSFYCSVLFSWQVMRAVPPKPPAKPAHPSQLSVRLEHHLAAWTLQLLTGLEGVADSVPLPVIYAAHTINTYLPPTIKPTGGHVSVFGRIITLLNFIFSTILCDKTALRC